MEINIQIRVRSPTQDLRNVLQLGAEQGENRILDGGAGAGAGPAPGAHKGRAAGIQLAPMFSPVGPSTIIYVGGQPAPAAIFMVAYTINCGLVSVGTAECRDIRFYVLCLYFRSRTLEVAACARALIRRRRARTEAVKPPALAHSSRGSLLTARGGARPPNDRHCDNLRVIFRLFWLIEIFPSPPLLLFLTALADRCIAPAVGFSACRCRCGQTPPPLDVNYCSAPVMQFDRTTARRPTSYDLASRELMPAVGR
ncbi:hypothetical protein EVAR_85278_1 [Eumeta japonica]|uniref:Uncharacterized protein n=1 Tax=Eumeta variegata TaxID=151549 RepID=A0A4C1V6T8_EUMVA|nr:hypothetical protein EVAR_85278_1 [Eumeta japonica]